MSVRGEQSVGEEDGEVAGCPKGHISHMDFLLKATGSAGRVLCIFRSSLPGLGGPAGRICPKADDNLCKEVGPGPDSSRCVQVGALGVELQHLASISYRWEAKELNTGSR